MKKILPTLALLALALCGAVSPSHAQQTATTAAGATRAVQAHLIGEVTAADAATGQLTVKTDAGASVQVSTDERTRYRRLPPGETGLDKAETITRADVRVGDRVLVPNGASGGEASAARQVIVMAREAITARREQEREDWRARGINGRIAAVDAVKKEFTVETRGREGAETITVAAAAGNVRFRRYAAGSLRPADAVAGSFAEIRIGDTVRVLGSREGARVTAEEVVSGTVARLMGTVEAVDAARNELSMKDSRTGQTVNVALVSNTTLRRIPAEFAETLRQRGERRREGAGERIEGETREQRRERRRAQRPEGEANRSGGGERGARQGGGGGRGGQMFENLPKITVGELKKGDSVMITGTAGADASRVTAATLMTGDAEILQRLQRFQRGGRQEGMSPGLPSGVMGGGTGEPPDRP